MRFVKFGGGGMFKRSAAVGTLCIAAMGQACAAGDQSVGSGTTVTDSAGIRIVDHYWGNEGWQGEVDSWDLAGSANLSIDSVTESGETREFLPSFVTALPNGQLAVVEYEDQRIWVFDRDGSLVRMLGGRGEGPGEYQRLTQLRLTDGDTLAAWDPELVRLTLYAPDGHAVDKVITPRSVFGQFPMFVGLADGNLFLRSGLDFMAVFAKGTGPQVDTAVVARYRVTDSQATVADTLGAWPALAIHAFVEGNSFSYRTSPFASQARFALRDGRVYVALGDRYEIQVWDAATGALNTLIRASGRERPPVTEADRSAYEARALENVAFAAEEEMLANIEYPERKSSYVALLVDDDGRIWVQETDDNGLWRVFDASGNMEAVVRVPDEFTLQDVRGDEVAGVYNVDAFRKSVRTYALVPR